jgi:hypothetical protein
MEPDVRQYEIQPRQTSLSRRNKVGMFFVMGGLTLIIGWGGERFFHWTQQSLTRSLLSSAVAGALFVFRPFGYWIPPGNKSLIIGPDFVEVRTRTGWLTLKKRIGREQIKSISENRRGIYVRDHGKLAAKMLGFIFVAATMPEYQEIKSILSGWAPLQTQR